METAGPSTRQTNLPLRMVIGYGAGNFAFALLGLVVAVNLQFFYTDYIGLSAGLVSWSLLLARMFDAVTDPVMGYLSDRSQTRLGRRRPYFLGAALPLGVAFYFLFAPPAVENPAQHQTYLLVYLLTTYTLTYLIWTIGAVPYFSLGAELTDDYQERVYVIAVREAWAFGSGHSACLPHLFVWRTPRLCRDGWHPGCRHLALSDYCGSECTRTTRGSRPPAAAAVSRLAGDVTQSPLSTSAYRVYV